MMIIVSDSLNNNTCTGLFISLFKYKCFGQSDPTESPRILDIKATSDSTIFEIPMRSVRDDQRHRRRFSPLKTARNSRDGNYSFEFLSVARSPRMEIVK